MNSYERVMTALDFKEPDRVPLVPSTRFLTIAYAGYTIGDCHRDSNKYVEAQEKIISEFNLDAAWDLAGVYYVSRAVGQKLYMPENDPPAATDPFVTSSGELDKLTKFRLEDSPVVEYQIQMNRRLRERVGKGMPLITYVESPFYLACVLRGTQELFMDFYENPGFVKELLECTTAISKKYGALLSSEGTDILYTACPQASKMMISKADFLEFVHPTFLEVFDYYRNQLNKKILFHVCGDWTDRFDLLVEERPDVLHVDRVDLKWLKEMCDKKVTINGNVGTTTTLKIGTPQEVEDEARRCIETAGPGGGFLLGGDCTLAADTPKENFRALVTAIEKYGSYPLKAD